MPNSYTNLLFHVVCSTKNRRPLIGDDWRGEFDKYVGGLVREKDRIVGAPWYSVRSAILVEMNNAGPTGLGFMHNPFPWAGAHGYRMTALRA